VAADHRVLACVGGKVYPSPSGPPIEDAVALIEDGKISTVADGGYSLNLSVSAEQIECKDKVIVAGLWNSHVHFETGWQDAANAPRRQTRSSDAGDADALGLHHRLGLGFES
jgi:cytosine/adenosine deaminase-related metal-dependent hydrolase